MTHVRQSIRAQVETMLGAALTNVAITRSRVYPNDTLPAVNIYTLQERANREAEGLNANPRTRRICDLAIEIKADATADVDDVVDALAAQIEVALATDRTLGGFATDSEYTNTRIVVDGSGSKPYIFGTLIYEVWYRTTALDPETAL